MKRPLVDTSFGRLFLAFAIIAVLMTIMAGFLFGKLTPKDYQHAPWVPGLLMGLLLQVLSLMLTAAVAARFLAKPMALLAQGAAELGRNLNSPPIIIQGPKEARQAAEVFNQMQQQIRNQVAERSRFLAAVSHDLRAPLTRMSLRLGRESLTEQREKLLADVGEMTALIDQTLEYLRGSGAGESPRTTDILALVEAVADDAREEGGEVGVTGMARPLAVRPAALRRCVENLVRNSLRYAGDCSIELHDASDSLQIAVCDRGPGIPEARLVDVLQPFVSLDESRNREHGGFGLGLAIATEIAGAHGGRLELRNREGGGLVATITVPRLAAALTS